MVELATDQQVWANFRHHSRTFSLATRLLPKPVRLPVAVVYAFCREVDTLADERVCEVGPERALEELAAMRNAFHATIAGNPPYGALWERLSDVHRRFELQATPFEELMEGARWDLEGRVVRTDNDLIAYSNLVGGSIGAMMLPFLVHDRSHIPQLDQPARDLGVAMQITNILRDVGEDRRCLQRCYLPADRLSAHGWTEHHLPKEPDSRYHALVEDLAELAESRYIRGLDAIGELPLAVQTGIRAAARMYREILNEVRALGYDNLNRRAYVPLSRKLRVLLTDRYHARKERLLQV